MQLILHSHRAEVDPKYFRTSLYVSSLYLLIIKFKKLFSSEQFKIVFVMI